MVEKKIKKASVIKEIEQNFKMYNRESGKKTLLFMGIMIAAITILSIIFLVLISRPRVLTSSIETESSQATGAGQK